jgi:hypothetical protein
VRAAWASAYALLADTMRAAAAAAPLAPPTRADEV